MRYLITTFLCFLFLGNSLTAQNATLSGYLKDAETGEELLYASVLVEGETIGTTTNLYGFYSLTLPVGEYKIAYSYLGYATQSIQINLQSDVSQSVELKPDTDLLEEVVVTAKAKNENIKSTEMSVTTLDVKSISKIPVLFGEQDIMKTMQLMPGISGASEGSSGFFVRGGNADQNLILLDEATVYNASHLLGFFSVFNSDALKDVKLYKGGIPAEYGGRASSVMDVRMKNGNSKEWGVSGGLGLISSRLTVEGPIKKDKGSILISGRRTYMDLLAKTFTNDFDDLSLYFYDVNMKANYSISEKDRIFFSAYLGKDVFGLEDFGFDWGNTTATLRWNHTFNSKLFSNTSLIYSDYNYGFNIDNAGIDNDLSAGIFDYNLKQDFTYFLNPKNKVKFGVQGIYHDFQPIVFTFDDELKDQAQTQQALETGIYISNEQKVSERLTLNYGLRASTFSNIGAFTEQQFNELDEVVNQTTYEQGEFYNNYWTLEPRFSASYVLNPMTSIKASYNRNAQYLHLLSNSNAGSPTDIWIPSSTLVKPTIADQVALGYFQNFNENKYKFSAEAYYKNFQNLVDYENGAEIFANTNIESELVFGKGRAYGIEFLLEKQEGKLTGWLSYTLSKSERQIDEINFGNWYAARQDRTHDISLVANYELSKNLSISATWVYNTGDAVTFPAGKYYIDDSLISLYTERNADRMPNYHRLDLGVNWTLRDNDKYFSALNFSLYNLYNRKNAYSISFAESETSPGTTEATRLSLFGIVPSVSWNFKF